jgi:hypothetical protein
MGYQRTGRGYRVRVDGMLLGESSFVIQAAVEYDAELSREERERLSAMAQLELLLAIQGEEARGRRLGAEILHVGVVGDEPLYRFFRKQPVTPRPARLVRQERPAARRARAPRQSLGDSHL